MRISCQLKLYHIKTRILNSYLRKVHKNDKLGILDVRVLLNNDTEIDIEINLNRLEVWPNRSLFYAAKMYTDQINPGDSYDELKKCVSISILDFKLYPRETECYSCFRILETTRHFLYTDRMEFHLLELPKLPEELKEDSSNILLWAKFINAERKEEFEMLAKRDPYINSAYQQLQVISQDEQKRIEYEAREKAIRDHNQVMMESREAGHVEGHAEGLAEGLATGEAKGRAEERQEIIQTMLETMSPEQVARTLKMPLEDVLQMR